MWVVKAATPAMAAAHSQHGLPPDFQLVSPACFTAAARTTSCASACGVASAALTSRSRFATVPNATGAAKTASAISSSPRLRTP
jgi:hypothetical protein